MIHNKNAERIVSFIRNVFRERERERERERHHFRDNQD